MACLGLGLRTAAVLLAPEHVIGPEIPDLVQQAQGLPVLDACVDPATLAAAAAPCRRIEVVEATVGARAAQALAAVEVSLGFLAPGRAILEQVASPAVAEPSVAARIARPRPRSRAEDDVPAGSRRTAGVLRGAVDR